MYHHRPFVGAAAVMICAVLTVVGVLLLGVTSSQAQSPGLNGSVTLTWPATARVGGDFGNFTARITITNTSTSPNDTETVRVIGLHLTPACKQIGPLGECLETDRDPGVFTLRQDVVGNLEGSGMSFTACVFIGFRASTEDFDSGKVLLTPAQIFPFDPPDPVVDLAPTSGDGRKSCTVELTLHVNKLPANPETGSVGTTHPQVQATLLGLSSGLSRSIAASTTITLVSVPSSTPPPQTPPPSAPPPPLNQIPTLSEWVMLLLAGFMVLVGGLAVRKRRTT